MLRGNEAAIDCDRSVGRSAREIKEPSATIFNLHVPRNRVSIYQQDAATSESSICLAGKRLLITI